MPSLNPCLRDFWLTPDKSIRVLYGGRSSSKSWDAAGMAILMAQTVKIKFLCVRQLQNRITDSVYTLLKDTIYRFNLADRFTITNKKIICNSTGSTFVFYGLWRHIEEIKSMEGVGVCWIEEAHLFTQEQWEILEPTLIRNDGYQFWIIFNPRYASDFVYKKFVINPPPDTIVRKINYSENPFLNNAALKVINHLKETDNERYEYIYGGNPKDDDNESIIKRTHILAAIGAADKLGLKDVGFDKKIGFDLADNGKDSCATVKSVGALVTRISKWKAKENEILKSVTKAYHEARKDDSYIIYDAIGVGSSCGAKLTELGYKNHIKFFAGGIVANPDKYVDKYTKIKNRDFYENIKAQAWWFVAEKLKNTYNAVHNDLKFDIKDMIFIDPSCDFLDDLIDELVTPKKSYSEAGKIMVEKKEAIKKRGLGSPDIADAFIMSCIDSTLITKKRGLM